MVRKTNTSNRKGLPKRKDLTVGKRGAPDAQRRAGFQRRKCPRVAKSENSVNIQGFQESLQHNGGRSEERLKEATQKSTGFRMEKLNYSLR